VEQASWLVRVLLSVASATQKSSANSSAHARVAWGETRCCVFCESSLSSIPGHRPHPSGRYGNRVRPRRLPALCAVLGESAPESRFRQRKGLRQTRCKFKQNLRHYQSFRLFRSNMRVCVFQSGHPCQWGDARRKLIRAIDKFLSADCASPSSISTIRQIFVSFVRS